MYRCDLRHAHTAIVHLAQVHPLIVCQFQRRFREVPPQPKQGAEYLSSFRTPPWELNLVFVNTGLEYPEIQKFVNEYAAWLRREFPRVIVNIHRLRPKMNIRQVVTKYGYSVIGKDVAHRIETARRSPESRSMKLLRGEVLRVDGEKSMYNCEKWEYLLSAPFLISDKWQNW